MGLIKSQRLALGRLKTLSDAVVAYSGVSFFKFVDMDIILERPLIFFDLETTGLSVSKDRICQISFTKFFPQPKGKKGKDPETKTRIINPNKLIPQKAIEVHGITNEHVKDAPTFKQIALSLSKHFDGCDIAGYNIMGYDIPLMREEFIRSGVDWPESDARIIDVYTLITKAIPRKLSDMYELLTGVEAKDAHDAEYDNMMCIGVLGALLKKGEKYQFDAFSKLGSPKSIQDLHDICQGEGQLVDYARKIIINPTTEEFEFNFGNHRGERVLDHKAYCQWMLAHDFTEDTKRAIVQIFRLVKNEKIG